MFKHWYLLLLSRKSSLFSRWAACSVWMEKILFLQGFCFCPCKCGHWSPLIQSWWLCVWYRYNKRVERTIFWKERELENLISLGKGNGVAATRGCQRTLDIDFEENTQRIFNRKREKLCIPITVFCISYYHDSSWDLLCLDDIPTQLLDLVLTFYFYWKFVMTFVWTSHSPRLSPMISGEIWALEDGEIMMEQTSWDPFDLSLK